MSLRFSPDPRLDYSVVCKSLILFNTLVYGAAVAGDLLGLPYVNSFFFLRQFGLFPQSVVQEGMYWTPFTYMFLHAGATHLLFNMFGLYVLGPDLEKAFGPVKFLGLYLLSGWIGGIGFTVISYALQGDPTPCVGASGAIFGLLGGIVALYPGRYYYVFPLMIPVKATVLATLLLSTHLFFIFTPYGNRVAYDAHLAGGITGFFFCGGAALLHRHRWRNVIPGPEIPYAAVELESLAHKIALEKEQDLPEGVRNRYEILRKVLRFEDVPSVEEIRARRP